MVSAWNTFAAVSLYIFHLVWARVFFISRSSNFGKKESAGRGKKDIIITINCETCTFITQMASFKIYGFVVHVSFCA